MYPFKICATLLLCLHIIILGGATGVPRAVEEEVATPSIGVVFSPLVRKGDTHNTQYYTEYMVGVMLEVIADANYTSVTTYGVGAPNKPFNENTLSECSSAVHTATALAKLNKKRGALAMTVYQGIYLSDYKDQIGCEIEVSFQTASEANKIFPGTVPAMVFSSSKVLADFLENAELQERVGNVFERAHQQNISLGVRIPDCGNIPTRSADKVGQFVSKVDFIICLKNPNQNTFSFGYKNFGNSTILTILQAQEYLTDKVGSSVELILESGWPGDASLKHPNSAEDLKRYWKLISDWAEKTGKNVFLHEAYDSPWKSDDMRWPFGANFGRWQYKDGANLFSKAAYVLKEDPATPAIIFGPTEIGIIAGIMMLTCFTLVIVVLYRRVRRIEVALLSDDEVRVFFQGFTEKDADFYTENVWEKPAYNTDLELGKDDISIDKSEGGLLGMGQFGHVYRGIVKSTGTYVAVKMTRPDCNQVAAKTFLSEIKMLAYIGYHKHVCSILGAYTREISKGIIYFSTELCDLGSLEKYLQKNRGKYQPNFSGIEQSYVIAGYSGIPSVETNILTESQLVRWSYEIASAMDFIGLKNVIHSDLATRNILLTSELTTKVTDFGLSRRLLEEDPNYAKTGNEPLPWKSLAPESLELKIFSSKSDVWSYGVTLWEIFSLGLPPRYAGVCVWNELLPVLKAGRRLGKPEYAPSQIYDIMIQCWDMKPEQRPSFDEIMKSLISLIDMDYHDLTE